MAKSKKKKRPQKRHKSYPPLSRTDKFIYTALEIGGLLFILVPLICYDALAGLLIFRNPDVLSFQERLTIGLILPFILIYLPCIANAQSSRIPLFGNKNVNYFNTVNRKLVFPLFDKRYKSMESRKRFLKKVGIWCCAFFLTFCLGVLGFIGRHEFSRNGITTYSIFNNVIEEHSYDEVESYDVSAVDYYRYTSRGSYHESNIYITVYLENGDDFSASYTSSRDIYALEELESLLKGKNKSVDTRNLQDFINSHSFTNDELKVIYRLFEV